MSDTPEIKLIIDKNWPKLTIYIKCNEHNDDVEGIITALQSFAEDASINLYPSASLPLKPPQKPAEAAASSLTPRRRLS